jgi:hypothetical protein
MQWRAAISTLVVVAACSLPLSDNERAWCAQESHLAALFLAAEELGSTEEVVEGHRSMITALEAGQDPARALNDFLSRDATIAACRLAYERDSTGSRSYPGQGYQHSRP